MSTSEFLERVQSSLQPQIIASKVYVGELTITVSPNDLYLVMKQLKEEFGFNYFVDIVTVDHFREEKRFEVNYNIVNLEQGKRLRVKTFVEEDNPVLESVVSIWPAANWHEREAYDMMGIRFQNHPDLRRMYMPEDFEYFPLRKEFPLIGIPGSIQMPEKDPPKEYK
ncbi:MAG: NADH-quinone oxidoreductase subunit C [Bacteroidia bacterium]|nr:NADH-quinone oxidoreductase subunit C [Bacteroidia bacterium]MDW8158935.1 NADH-quinone oxidoreductase subunit C [Bacteroidia bacterium]